MAKKDGRANNGGARPGAGRRKDLDKAALKEALRCIKNHGMQTPNDETEMTRIEMIYEKLFEMGIAGNYAAAKEYMDRQMGKAVSKTELTGKDGKDLKVITGFNFVKNKKE